MPSYDKNTKQQYRLTGQQLVSPFKIVSLMSPSVNNPLPWIDISQFRFSIILTLILSKCRLTNGFFSSGFDSLEPNGPNMWYFHFCP